MTEFEETLQHIQELPLKNKIDIVVHDILSILPALQKKDPSNNGILLVRTIIASAVAADGTLSNEELALIKAVFKVVGVKTPITKRGVLDFINQNSGPTSYKAVQALNVTMTDEEKRHLFSAVLAISAADGKISEHEAGFICSLLDEPALK